MFKCLEIQLFSLLFIFEKFLSKLAKMQFGLTNLKIRDNYHYWFKVLIQFLQRVFGEGIRSNHKKIRFYIVFLEKKKKKEAKKGKMMNITKTA